MVIQYWRSFDHLVAYGMDYDNYGVARDEYSCAGHCFTTG